MSVNVDQAARGVDAITSGLLRYVFAGVAWSAIGLGCVAAIWLIWN